MKKFLITIILYTISLNLARAQYAKGGSSPYKSSIYWLSWQLKSDLNAVGLISANCNANITSEDGGTIGNGLYIWNVLPNKVRVVGMVDNLLGTLRTSNLQNGWSLGFLNMYSGVKPIGIGATNETVSLNLKLSTQYNQGSISSPQWINLDNVPGIVVADAESLNAYNGEVITATINAADGAMGWEALEYDKGGLTADNNNYTISINNSSSSYTATLSSSNDAKESAVIFARGASQLTNLTIKGEQQQFMAIGIVLPFDYGDASISFGGAPHFLSGFDDNGATHILSGGQHIASNMNGSYTYHPYSNAWLGNNRPDVDTGYQASMLANGDNITGVNDEDGIASATLLTNEPGLISIPITVNNNTTTSSYLYSWLDINKNGLFESSELNMTTIPANTLGTKVDIKFNKGSLLNGDSAYARFRISNKLITGDGYSFSSNLALDGEAEDFLLPITYQVLVHAYNDGSGITDNSVYGNSMNTADNQLYAYLVDDNNIIVAKQSVGSYSSGQALLTAPRSQYYNAVISNLNQDTGVIFQSFSSDTWTYSGSDKRVSDIFYGNNRYGNGTTVTSNALVKVFPEVPSVLVGEVSYAFDKKPVASKKSYAFDNSHNLQIGDILAMSSASDEDTNVLGQLTGTDLEDGNLNGDTKPTLIIKSLPKSGVLLYQNNPVTIAQIIQNYRTSDLSFKVTSTYTDYYKDSFLYSFVDKANIASLPAAYNIIYNNNLILPVTMTNLSATLQQNNQVLVKWNTVSELNSKSFDVERSSNFGKTWSIIGTVGASNNSNELKTYQFLDKNPQSVNNYRLRMNDLDGSLKTSGATQTIYLTDNNNIIIYPIPADNEIFVDPVKIGEEIRVVGIDGKVYSKIVSNKSPQNINVSTLVSGVYFIQVIQKDRTVCTIKFIKK